MSTVLKVTPETEMAEAPTENGANGAKEQKDRRMSVQAQSAVMESNVAKQARLAQGKKLDKLAGFRKSNSMRCCPAVSAEPQCSAPDSSERLAGIT